MDRSAQRWDHGDWELTPDPYETLRNGLIWGRWKSGERLIPQHLKEEFGCTSSVLREALLRLAGEGLILSERNLGFRAVAFSRETFRQAAHMRLLLEQEGLALALKHGDFDWEMAVAAAYSKLTHVEKQMMDVADVTPFIRRWSIQDWEFHSTLMQACGSGLLLRAYKTAFDTFRMYNVAEMQNYGFSHRLTMQEHRAIFEAVSARDAGQAAAALETHLALFEDGNRSPEPMPSKM